MTATAYDNTTTAIPVSANDSEAGCTQRLQRTGLNWRESPQSLLRQSVMKTADSYPTLIIIGTVQDDED